MSQHTGATPHQPMTWLPINTRPSQISASYRPLLLIVVEGRHDIEFLRRTSTLLHAWDSRLPNLAEHEQAGHIVFLPAGGGSLGTWLQGLAALRCLEFHLYDRELPPVTTERLALAAAINRRPLCRAEITSQRSAENYLHPDAIREAGGISIQFTATDDVAEMAARAAFVERPGQPSWRELSHRARRRFRERAKIWLNSTAVDRMTPQRLAASDPAGDVIRWHSTIAAMLAEIA